MLEAHKDSTEIVATTCTYDGLSTLLVEEAGFPVAFLAGHAMASTEGQPETGYIAMQDVCAVIQQAVRQVHAPIIEGSDPGDGSLVSVKRVSEYSACAGAAGVMIEDQAWPKRRAER